MLVVIGTDCIGSCKSNYHTIMITTAPTEKGVIMTLLPNTHVNNATQKVLNEIPIFMLLPINFDQLIIFLHRSDI